jgi:F subunit of K+-transporting ATPase (Potass_KdpF)
MIAAASDTDNWVGLVLASLAVVYLILVIVFPERF